MNPRDTFLAFAYEDMPPMAHALRHSSITTTRDYLTYLTKSRRIASRTATERPLITATNSRAAFPIHIEDSPTVTKCNGVASSNDTQYSPIAFASADAASSNNARHPPRTAASDQAASHVDTEPSPTAIGNVLVASIKTCPVTPPLSALREPAHHQLTHKANVQREPTTLGKRELLTTSAGDILTALIKCQVNLPTKEIILATGNPLGMMIATKKKFVLCGGKIRDDRVKEGQVLQVSKETFRRHMAEDYDKAFVNGVEELRYPLVKPLARTRAPRVPLPALTDIRAAVAKEVEKATKYVVECIVTKLVKEAVESVIEDLEKEVEVIVAEVVEVIVAEVVEEVVACSVERPGMVNDMELEGPFVASWEQALK